MNDMSQQGRRNVVAIVWAAVGLFLIWRGLPYAGLRDFPASDDLLEQVEQVGLDGSDTWIALAVAVVVGLGKGFTMLRKAGRRAATQIASRGEQAAAWTVFSPYMIVLVGLMIVLGVTLRTADYDATVKAWTIGILYPGIGVALLIGGLLARNATPLPPKTSD
jgi:hypothetical protein